jgi:hypothetical protein
MFTHDLLNDILNNSLLIQKLPTNEELELLIIFYLLKKYNLRISEILRLQHSDVLRPNIIRVTISKTNEKFLLYDEYCIKMIDELKYSKEGPVFLVKYNIIHRYICKHHQEFILSGITRNRKVTHSFRYINSKKISEYFKDEATTAKALHHKSFASQKYYLRKKKSKVK